MIRAITIAVKDLIIAARDRNGFIMLLAMPFVALAILGFALGGLFRSDLPRIEPFEVGIVDFDAGAAGDLAALFEQALADPAAQGLMLPVRLGEDEARRRVLGGGLAGAVVFTEGCSERAALGQPVGLSVMVDPGRSLLPDVIRIATQTFSDQVFATGVALAASPRAGDSTLAAEIGRRIRALTPALTETVAQKGGQLSAFQYYSAAIAVMFLLFAGSAGVQSICAERRQMTFMRIQAGPGSAWAFAFGKSLGVFLVALAQFVILMVGMRWAFGISWGSSPLLCLGVAAGYAWAVSGLAIMVSALISEEKTALDLWNITTQVLAAFGGSMWPISFFPAALRKVAAALPNYWALRGLLGALTGENLHQLAPAIAALVGLGLLGLLLGSARLART